MFPRNHRQPLLYPITTGAATNDNFRETSGRILNLIETAVAARISLVQIREKRLAARLLYELVERAAKITRNTETKLLVNDRADIALAADADGVHLTEYSISARIVRKNFPENFIIGVSCHSPESVLKAKTDGADFAAFSPIFASPGKGEPQGLEKLRRICELAKPFPVIALGGIDESNFKSIVEAGAAGAAAIRLFNDAEKLSRFAEKGRRFSDAR